MRTKILLAAFALAAFISCSKNEQPPALPGGKSVWTGAFKQLRINLDGDLSIGGESPLGRKAPQQSANARGLRDSTVYMVRATVNGVVYGGIFNIPDSIVLTIPDSGTVRIVAFAYHKGNGPGLYYSWNMNKQVYTHPMNAVLNNHFELAAYNQYKDSIDWTGMASPLDTNTLQQYSIYPEIDVLRGDTTFNAATITGGITMPLKRQSFGIKITAPGFTSGELIISGTNPSVIYNITPATIGQYAKIYATDAFRNSGLDFVNRTVTISYNKPGGGGFNLGTKTIQLKRNVMTTIQIRLPLEKLGTIPVNMDTAWSSHETINF